MSLHDAAALVDTPEDGVPTLAIIVVEWMRADGEREFAAVSYGESTLANGLGLLRLAEHSFVEALA